MQLIDPIDLTISLVKCKSVTPDDDGALYVLANELKSMGFDVKWLNFTADGTPPINNFFARIGNGGRHLCFMGHTDVVPTGDPTKWTSPPFMPEIRDGKLYGRGVADMKGGNAAFIAAVSCFLSEHRNFDGSISLLITGDEEGPSINGSVKVIEWMVKNGQIPDVALVGEPSNNKYMGDTIKIGRRGSLNGHIVVRGVQGHVAYPELAINPIPKMVVLLNRLITEKFDNGTDDFQPTNLEITTVDVGNNAGNVIPALAQAKFNIRFNNLWDKEKLDAHLRAVLNEVGIAYDLNTSSTAPCFLTPPSEWRNLVKNAVHKISGHFPSETTGGGTSDARFIAGYCPVVEYGLLNSTIHKVDECAAVDDINELTETYHEILKSYFLKR